MEPSMMGLLVPLPKPRPYSAQEYAPVPLTGVQISVQVVGCVAQVYIVQEYENKEKNPIEVIYFFPVEEEAAVTECSAELEGRIVVAKITENAKAQKIYDDAIEKKKTAILLAETKADIFQLNVGHLSPGASCKVKITYTMELLVENDKTKLTIPTTVAPRYVSAQDMSEVARKVASIEHDFNSPAPLYFQMEVAMKDEICSIESPSHNLVTQRQENPNRDGLFHASAVFEGFTAEMDRDIVVLIDSKEATAPKIIIEKGEDGSVAAMVSIVPKFELKKQPSEVVFLIDCSGSMSGSSIKLAKEALHLFIHSLPVDCYFNIYLFGSTFSSLFPESKLFTDETLDMAKKLMRTLDANLGGTEIFKPLETIFRSVALVGKPRQVFVLTDGEVGDSLNCVQLVQRYNQHNRVFTLGIGASADRHLVKGLARAGQGVASFATYGEKIAGKVLKQLKQSLQPCVHNVQIDWGRVDADDGADCCQAPVKTPPVYDGRRMLVYKLWEKEGSLGEKVIISAEKPEGKMTVEVNIEANCIVEGDLIHKMFARKMIQDLEEKHEAADSEELKSLITDLGLKYRLATKYTSFVGVDEASGEASGAMITRQVRNQLAQGYGGHCGSAVDMLCSDEEEGEDDYYSSPPGASAYTYKECAVMMAPRMLSKESYLGSQYSSEEEEDNDMEFGLFGSASTTIESDTQTTISSVEKLNTDGLLKLTSLQTAVGYFKEDAEVEKLIGEKFGIFKRECEKKGIEPRQWLTALILAYIETHYSGEQDCWELIVEKGRDWLGGEELLMAARECLQK